MRSFVSISLLASVSLSVGAETPKQPWSDFTVHDKARPVPKHVEAQAVTVKAPSDAIVLFDGANTDAFTVPWTVRDGIMIATAKDTHSKQAFASCQLHLEWRIPVGRKVNGQTGGNSGVFLMDLYEVQILQSHNNRTYADGQAGALYGQTPPLVNATSAQGEWQSYDILFTAPIYKDGKVERPAYVTVIHNGVVVQNQQVLYGPTEHRIVTSYPVEHPEKAPLRLQWHGDPVEYRNIWIRPL